MEQRWLERCCGKYIIKFAFNGGESRAIKLLVIKFRKDLKNMNKTYTIINKFQCCGKTMLTVMVENNSVCVMPDWEFSQIIRAERRFKQMKKHKKVA